ncbi:hypothetical protein [Tautonia sociabilis]|uniref:Uncharacterized protein n=1 Tax=Tautonia sociabilis TaxID=2080755 RepID=A0A432MJ26_9BACT|nr:hypothetical protein [Tautonia sociabilis]RUL87299.1 hypothetical protein TsocGM_13050 [Tautonia sociabilis]
MPPESNDLARLAEAVEALRREVARLSDRVAAIESASSGASPDPVSQELVYVISAAVAAFLGKRAHVRQIRLLGSAAWAQQGRVTVQASHRLGGPHGA